MINGYKDGLFKPNETLNRAEFLKLLVSAVNAYPTTVSYAQCFKDVKNEWFAPTICYAKSKGWISGYADKSFHPSDPVKKAEALKIVLSAFKAKFLTVSPDVSFVDVADDEWFASYVWTAQRDLLLQEKPTLNREYKPLAPVTRAEVVELLYRALKTYSASI